MPENTQANTFATGQMMNQALFSVYDAGKPEYVKELAKRFGLQTSPFWRWLEGMLREEAIPGNTDWYAYEENRYRRELKVLSTVADPGVGNPITFQLDPAYIDTYGNYYGREGEAVTIPVTNVQAHISSITGTSPNIFFTLTPINVSSNIGSLVAGTKLAITNGAKADGTHQGKSAVTGATKRNFRTQIFFEDTGLEGTQITTQKWYDAFDDSGKKVGVVTDLTAKAQARLDSKINGAFLLGQTNTNTNLTQVSAQGQVNPINYTEGLIPTITRLGSTLSIPYGTFAVDDLNDIGLYMRTQGVTSGIVMLAVGARRRNEIEDACKNFIQGNGTDLTSDVRSYILGNKPADKLLSVGFQQIYKGGVNILLNTIEEFSDPVGLGLTGYDMDKAGMVIPLSTMKDPKSGKVLDNIAIRYVENNGYSRKLEVWANGAAGGDVMRYDNDIDEKLIHMRAHLGLQILMANQMMYIPGA